MQSKSFMIVDDSNVDRFVHVKLLRLGNISADVVEFTNGMDALDHLKLNQEDAADLPDIILLDIMMPEMDGFDFLVHFDSLVKTLAKVPKIFMLSSSEDETDQQRANENKHVERLLKKPFSPKSFLEHLEKLKF